MIWWQKKPFIDAIEGYEKISDREQNIVLFTLTSVLILLIYTLLIEPLVLSAIQASEDRSQAEGINQSLSLQIEKTRSKQFQDPNEPLRKKLAQITRQSDEMQDKINLLTQALVAPKEMVSLLGKVLKQDKKLKLISLVNLPEQAMNIDGRGISETQAQPRSINNIPTVANSAEGNKDDDEKEALIYKHAFEIELEATYGATLGYLKRLDQLPWQLFWQDLTYESKQYPMGRLKIKIYTLSTSKEVLGV
jgi:MSHA biogenesis protein MshJ